MAGLSFLLRQRADYLEEPRTAILRTCIAQACQNNFTHLHQHCGSQADDRMSKHPLGVI
jgi:hypothetical protein